ncbi:histidine kinase [Thioalkalivibrio versutus]|uniref:Histidine kinase n=1 Tax=Thioalkalivibrio versutus TaxID=106634 RepID=A0A0G3G0M0_9GAMM|nr:GAF domain-containing protein [Thioalkalivibrio versutus]AKJ93934.1 histidine kinase [Thioalkalivibrio versutus]
MGEAFDAFDERLMELAHFVEEAESLEKGLAGLAALVSHAMECERCSIMLLKPDPDGGAARLRVQAHHGYLPDHAYDVRQPLGSGISGRVASARKGLLIRDLHASDLAAEARRAEGAGPVDVIAVPVILEGDLLGVINIDSPEGRGRLTQEDLRRALILALVVAKSVLVHRLKGLLRTSFTQMALARQPGAATGPITHAPERVARLLARTLYDEMSRAGFSRDHVLIAATELIGQVSEGRE